MANGRFWLVPLGIGGPILRTIAVARTSSGRLSRKRALPIYIAAGLGIGHALSTVKAASINWAIAPWQPSERRITDEEELAQVFNRFERWQTVRASLQFLTFAAGVWALAASARE